MINSDGMPGRASEGPRDPAGAPCKGRILLCSTHTKVAAWELGRTGQRGAGDSDLHGAQQGHEEITEEGCALSGAVIVSPHPPESLFPWRHSLPYPRGG